MAKSFRWFIFVRALNSKIKFNTQRLIINNIKEINMLGLKLRLNHSFIISKHLSRHKVFFFEKLLSLFVYPVYPIIMPILKTKRKNLRIRNYFQVYPVYLTKCEKYKGFSKFKKRKIISYTFQLSNFKTMF